MRNKKAAQGEAPGPDERRPERKADEIYGDTENSAEPPEISARGIFQRFHASQRSFT